MKMHGHFWYKNIKSIGIKGSKTKSKKNESPDELKRIWCIYDVLILLMYAHVSTSQSMCRNQAMCVEYARILAHSCTFTMMRIRGTFNVHWTKFHSRILTMKKVHITYSHVKTQTIAFFLLTCTLDYWTMYCCVDIMVYKNQFWLRGMAINFYVLLTWNFVSRILHIIDC